MSGVNLSDHTHKVIETMSYDHRTSRKDIIEKMFTFAMAHEKEFLLEMFEKKEEDE